MRNPGADLVERTRELTLLADLLARARHGEGGAVRILGPAGVGKTSLVRATTSHARDSGMRSWTATAGQLESAVPFGVVRRLLDRPVRDLGPDGRAHLASSPAQLALRSLWPMADGGSATQDPAAPAPGDVMHSLGWLVEEIATDGPFVLAVDDAQWADEESLLFLGSLRDRISDLPLLVMTAARDEGIRDSPALAAHVAERDAVVLRLEALSPDGIHSLLADRWSSVPDGTTAAVTDVTGGNPFLVIALAHLLSRSIEVPTPAAIRAAVPDTVVDLVTARLGDRAAVQQRLAAAVAVLDTGPLDLAAALAEVDIDQAAEAADRLREGGLFDKGATLGFRHALLRSAAHSLIGTSTVDRLHRRAAGLLADRGEVAAAAAHLLASAGASDPWSVDVLRRAADDALTRGAPHTAAILLQRAVDEPAPEPARADLLHALGMAQMRAYDPACVTTLQQAIATATDPGVRRRASLDLSRAFNFAGLYEIAATTLDDVRRDNTNDHPPDLTDEARLALDAAWVEAALLVPSSVATARELAASYGELAGSTAAQRLMLIQQMSVAAGTNQPAAVIRSFAQRAIGDWDSPEQSPETTEWAWPRLFLAMIGDHQEAARMADVGRREADARGSVLGLVTADFIRAFTDLHAGDLLAAEDGYRTMLDHGASLGGGMLVETLGRGGLAQCLAAQGHTDEAFALLATFPEEFPPDAPNNGVATVWVARAATRRAVGDHVGALRAVDELERLVTRLDVDSPTWVAWRAFAVEPLRALGRVDEARTVASAHLALCEAGAVPDLYGEALCLAGLVAASPEEALDLLERGTSLLATTTSRLRHGLGLLALGSALRRAGRKLEARDPLRSAAAVLTGCGAHPAALTAQTELAATGVRLNPRTDHDRLTPSEQRIAELAADGLGNRDIALHLHVSRKTVEAHLSSVYRKLGVAGREQLTPRESTTPSDSPD